MIIRASVLALLTPQHRDKGNGKTFQQLLTLSCKVQVYCGSTGNPNGTKQQEMSYFHFLLPNLILGNGFVTRQGKGNKTFDLATNDHGQGVRYLKWQTLKHQMEPH